ncbi:uncharacterized protein NP_2204A [Natronomonas pharaonis DSM 2160]|uniref:Uncharacterized protein n=1 Tax=Natronomonas pharaonis (strain ATCC 35678 / DSM 2160 / CIP 103997 / JCM 8858 / NBRC 14720 / NCIMB 2260 / Gabara) TaxID=348780 RepID=A0A1U7EVV7_NATPD|nr:uncharacterized protein NP_2204A [Natronomonas pharaonis DSM 2160]
MPAADACPPEQRPVHGMRPAATPGETTRNIYDSRRRIADCHGRRDSWRSDARGHGQHRGRYCRGSIAPHHLLFQSRFAPISERFTDRTMYTRDTNRRYRTGGSR